MPWGEVGEVPFGVCESDAAADMSSASSGASDPLRDLAPMRLFFSLNFSIQWELRAAWFSGLAEVVENARAFSRIRSSVNGRPFRSC